MKLSHLIYIDRERLIYVAWKSYRNTFNPWKDNFSQGLYLAGLECYDDALAPEGWTKWIVPGYEYIYIECESTDTFPMMIEYLNLNDIRII